ncbi:hypothetical protein NIB75_10775 [Bacteroides uniformis]|nr:hypothetical protein [Bacteroides uniformis]
MVSGEYAFAFSCFTQAGKSDLPTLYNKALCCYYLSLYNDCRSLLLEAEAAATVNGTSAGKPAGSRPPLGIRKSPAGCPMPEDAPDNLAAVQLLRLKAKVSARLHLHTEVRTIHARLGNKYQHIEELIKTYNHEIQ